MQILQITTTRENTEKLSSFFTLLHEVAYGSEGSAESISSDILTRQTSKNNK
jgi:hypothetical protein